MLQQLVSRQRPDKKEHISGTSSATFVSGKLSKILTWTDLSPLKF
jgi:hypothetical protein